MAQNPKFLTIPSEYGEFPTMGGDRSSSPPPDRRCSNASTMSTESFGSSLLSTTLPSSSSYQNLVSPMCGSALFFNEYSIDDMHSDSSNQEVYYIFVLLYPITPPRYLYGWCSAYAIRGNRDVIRIK